MHWRRSQPLQEVAALLFTGADAGERLAAGLAAKSPLFRSLPVAQGEGWAALFAAAPAGDEAAGPVLPRLEDAMPLYEEAPGWFLPVGIAPDVPAQARESLREAAARHFGFKPPAIVAPRFAVGETRTRAADVYLVRLPKAAPR